MEISVETFLKKFSDQLENTDPAELNLQTDFKELGEWDSLIALSLVAMADEFYKVRLSGEDINNAATIGDVYNIIKSRSK